ncbi:TetR/AcrR family transcriptional regulator [Caldinitratiruptor microaerophilus]|uniref:TetR family transcriptional regulator n=1 Tax=Caldinitratiruptor microaerophilus TaxID=671077 RepID=A0AA35G8Q8_9FIRM|nr:TetR/AcrR family transcriptional regulator [Caldinitratiruptor microaerophilus]BDG60693.1 TetR family transcriptional regulator [Caldinitratiruptor microaerophilus]
MSSRAPWTEAAERRRLIVEAALPVFASHSYSGATTTDVARAARVAQATIYKHFPTKRDLFLAVLDRTTDLVLERWQQAMEGAPTPLDRLVALVRTYAMMAATDHLAFRVRVRAVAESGDPVIATHARASYLRIVEFLRDVIEEARAAGQTPPDLDPARAAWYLLSVGQGFNLNHYVGLSWDPATIDGLIAYVFRGLGVELAPDRPPAP